MIFGDTSKSFVFKPVEMNNVCLSIVDQWKYLGVIVKADKRFSCSTDESLSSFYRASNSILNVLKKPSEQIQLKLLYSCCVPILSYACEVKVVASKAMTSMNTAINDCIRKIFTFNRWESVRTLRSMFSYNSIYDIFAARQKSFLKQLLSLDNRILYFVTSKSLLKLFLFSFCLSFYCL